MNTQAGDRLRALRVMIGLEREEMAELLGVSKTRYKNVEQKNARMAEDVIGPLCQKFPELCLYITCEGEIDLNKLKESQEKLVNVIAAKIEAGLIPEGSYIESVVK